MNHIINIFCNTDTVGYIDLNLEENSGELHYDESWKKENSPLSPHLPFDGITNETNLKKFISNLLPEGEGLEFVSRFFQISKANHYGLIEAIGIESAGALTFTNQKIIPTSFRKFSKEELTLRIQKRKSKNITIWDDTPRLSVAGVQDKLPIVIVDDIFGIGQGEISSTHILKFSKNKEQHIVINEHFCMELATLCGLKTANTTILNFDNEKVLAVERFDREIIKENDSFKVQKIHIIDGCQLLNLDVIMKYQKPYGGANQAQVGASFKKLTRGIEFCKTKALAKLEITRWGLFNLLINNFDAHAKNISFFVTKSGLEVAPFYDLVNIALYSEFQNEFAFSYGEEFDPKDIGEYAMVDFCKSIEIHPRLFKQEFSSMVKNIKKNIKNLQKQIAEDCTEEEKIFLASLVENIGQTVLKYEPIVNDFTNLYKEYENYV